MKRYNQGFGKFGPMEQCNDGEWVRYEDSERVINNLRDDIRNLHRELLITRKVSAENYKKYKIKKYKLFLYLICGMWLGAIAAFIGMML
jgi:F0F1-type ATP synthase assembly protein I